jgi:hypothetical protein
VRGNRRSSQQSLGDAQLVVASARYSHEHAHRFTRDINPDSITGQNKNV